MSTGAVGGRTTMRFLESIDVGLAVKSDALWVRTKSDAVSGLAGATGDYNRIRFILEAARFFRIGDGTTLAPTGELGLRRDGGDAETGTGLEGGLGLRFGMGMLSVEGAVRGLVVHQESGYKEWGARGSILVAPASSGRGFSLRMAPSWGDSYSGTQRLWSAREAADLAPYGGFEPSGNMDTEIGYGVRLGSTAGTLTPYAGLSFGDSGDRALRIGLRSLWRGSQLGIGTGATLYLEVTRRETPLARAVNAVRIQGGARF